MNVDEIRELFPGLKHTIYLNTATMNIGCTPAREAYGRAVEPVMSRSTPAEKAVKRPARVRKMGR
jgi:hypothetical protein